MTSTADFKASALHEKPTILIVDDEPSLREVAG